MRFFLDTEFVEDGVTIDLISIGVVAEDGREYYAETEIAEVMRAGVATNVPEWVQENVVPHLRGGACVKPTYLIADELIDFVGEAPEFWAYFADYDWVVLCQLYGRMLDLPAGWPMYCRDLRQALDERDLRDVKAEPSQLDGAAHDALADARAVYRTWAEYIPPHLILVPGS